MTAAAVFTFHYVSILISICSNCFAFQFSFTFHYVSILITAGWYPVRLLKQLYIPLCLYYNVPRLSPQKQEHNLYIPLCLYFNFRSPVKNSVSLSFTFHYVSILIFHTFSSRPLLSPFTFHYVSILMKVRHLAKSVLSSFTFHYVSILIQRYKKGGKGLCTLHSIMSLF